MFICQPEFIRTVDVPHDLLGKNAPDKASSLIIRHRSLDTSEHSFDQDWLPNYFREHTRVMSSIVSVITDQIVLPKNSAAAALSLLPSSCLVRHQNRSFQILVLLISRTLR